MEIIKTYLQINAGIGSLHKLLLLSATLISFLCAPVLQAQTVALGTQRLSDNMLLIQGPDFNVLAVESSEGIILVDGGPADYYDSLRQVVEQNFPGTPIRALINTHWHPEQTGANVPLGKEGVEIIAHENTMLWLSTEIWQRWSDRKFHPIAAEGLPTTTVWDDGSLQLGDTTIYYGFIWNAHTDGDIWVYFEDEDVLVTGGLVANGRWPEIDWTTGGYIGGMLDGFVSLLTVPGEDTRIIPASGDIMNLEELKAQNQMYLTFFDRLHGYVIQSFSMNDVLAEKPTAEYDAEMGDPTRFVSLAFQSFQHRYRDPQNFRLLNIP